ncbi:hypothetical protein SAMN05421770_10278 [Granulicella rosea]|uniref:Uncharacterized protein n=1 Tax=Granulicella rosea TaxID=474952 RepID=A0A239GTT9_9BACT|nr:hypothetical protein [Granulicella rosea]SNS72540.1 hypothetical protein SAMN05421770_10278 [Granulicella rosea]
MKLFWQKRALPETSEKVPAPEPELIRRLEITIERETTLFLVRRRNHDGKEARDEVSGTKS